MNTTVKIDDDNFPDITKLIRHLQNARINNDE